MPMNRAQFKKQLQEGLNAVFGMEYARYPEEWRKLVTVETESKKAYVEDVLMTGFGAAPVKAEGAGVEYDAAGEGYVARYVFETIALAFAITEEAEEDGLYGSLGAKYAKALARSLQHTKEVKGANLLNNGFTAGAYAGGDGVALFSASHPLRSGGTASNLLTAADISEPALEDALIQIGQATDDRGLPIRLMAQDIVIPINSQFTTHRILKSTLRSGTANNDANAMKDMGMLRSVVVNHYLTDTDAWFITTDCPDGLKHIVRKGVSTKVEGDFESGNMRYKARERYVFGWSDWRGVYGNAGA